MLDLKSFRESKKLTQPVIAEILDCNTSFVSSIENGRNKLSKEHYEKLYLKYGDELKAFEKDSVTIDDDVKTDPKKLEQALKLIDLLQKQNEAKDELIKTKDVLIQAKDEIIDLLKKSKK
jgi:transcriptional regulator with XRE-family HTH domain